MSNGEVCCILGVCCPSGSAKQRNALATELAKSGGLSAPDSDRVAGWLLKTFDFAPAGSLGPFKDAIVTMAQPK